MADYLELAASGATLHEICAATGLKKRTLQARLHRRGMSIREGRNRMQREELAALVSQGYVAKQIAAKLNIPLQTVYDRAYRFKIMFRARSAGRPTWIEAVPFRTRRADLIEARP